MIMKQRKKYFLLMILKKYFFLNIYSVLSTKASLNLILDKTLLTSRPSTVRNLEAVKQKKNYFIIWLRKSKEEILTRTKLKMFSIKITKIIKKINKNKKEKFSIKKRKYNKK